MDVPRGLLRLCLLLLALAGAAVAVAPGSAQGQFQPQCSDLVDNDSDGAIDGADAGCGDGSDDDETDSPYAGIVVVTVPLPVVTLQGTVDLKGNVLFTRVGVRAIRGSTVDIRCKGKRCPFKRLNRIMITSSLRLDELEGRLRAPMVIEMRIRRLGQLGKYLRYEIRRKKPPRRTDSCLDQTTGTVRPGFVG